MKRLLITLAALLAFNAHAEVFAVSKTTAGGEIKLTTLTCATNEHKRFMYVTTPSGEVFKGCWVLLDTDIYVVFDDGMERMYNARGFTLRKPLKEGKGGTL